MAAADRVQIELGGPDRLALVISLLPFSKQAPTASLIDAQSDGSNDPTTAPVQLLEGTEYRYELLGGPSDTFEIEPREVFIPDEPSGRSGRLRPGLYTGTLAVEVKRTGKSSVRASLEVRSWKLDYLQQYRWMLRDLAEELAEFVLQRFAPASARFKADRQATAATLYQRFAFIRGVLEDAVFQGGLHQVLSRPHVSFEREPVRVPASRGFAGSSSTVRALLRPGPRVPLPRSRGQLSTVPRELEVTRTDADVDNLPNQFAKHALEHFQATVRAVREALQAEPDSNPVRRGLAEVAAVEEQLDEYLGHPLFREVSPLMQAAGANQVLMKRHGYRELMRAYVQFDIAASLSWDGGEDVFAAGQRNVAQLYEFWAFLQLAKELSEICGGSFDLGSLIQPSADGLSLDLRRGRSKAFTGQCVRFGRKLELQLWFNRTFSRSTAPNDSWTRRMRPDCSVLLRSAEGDTATPVWLHFDAKYRVEQLDDVFGAADEDADAERDDDLKRDDLLKMHAYRDAIRRTAGAYVLFPGDGKDAQREYKEILPGVGGFGLRPTSAGEAEGRKALRRFLEDVVEHFATQTSQHERARYWTDRAFDDPPPSGRNALSQLTRPPADSLVMLGYVKSPEHRAWVKRVGLYNLRAGDRRGAVALNSPELSAEWLVIYGRADEPVELFQIEGRPEVHSRGDLEELSYPQPGGDLYLCLPVRPVGGSHGLRCSALMALRERLRPTSVPGAPVVISWSDAASVIP